MSRYSFSTSTSSVGLTGTPLRARQRPPAFWAFLSVERMRVGWSDVRCGTHGRTDTRQGTQQPRCGTSACLVDTFRLGALFRACSRF